MGWLSLACFVLAAAAAGAFGSDPPKPPPPPPPPHTAAADAAAAAERQKAARRKGAGANRLTDPRGTAGDHTALGGGPQLDTRLYEGAPKTKLGG